MFRRALAYCADTMSTFLIADLEYFFFLAATIGTNGPIATFAEMLSQENTELLRAELAFFDKTARQGVLICGEDKARFHLLLL